MRERGGVTRTAPPETVSVDSQDFERSFPFCLPPGAILVAHQRLDGLRRQGREAAKRTLDDIAGQQGRMVATRWIKGQGKGACPLVIPRASSTLQSVADCIKQKGRTFRPDPLPVARTDSTLAQFSA